MRFWLSGKSHLTRLAKHNVARRFPHQHFVLKERQCHLPPNVPSAKQSTQLPQYTDSKSVEAKATVPLVMQVSDLLQTMCCVLVIAAGCIVAKHLISTASTTVLLNSILEMVAFVVVLFLAMVAYKKFHGIKMS
jgi:energy-converting hydrogenase Eha subunit F